ncbi:MAG TPA: tRNA (adenosine(37)-N6)-dimethylallyltransferase MiaA [Candidatus Baltobacteraceae bacterium]|jgi:tRNA dimethylallyltransferase|nr:tRNA (adenosine(37)-N6)-dimethylallyltransferase MiaA [Candidatus Baltobacteraceae bacterium]
MNDGVLILTGPTASGKTALAIEIAEVFGCEIISADARQIYRGMPIGTAAPSEEECQRVPHHLVGFLDPRERYSAARFVKDATRLIGEIHARGRRVVVVGGTGFYLRALCGDVRLGGTVDFGMRERLAREAKLHPPEFLHEWLAVRAPARAQGLAARDTYRVIRALEIALAPRVTSPVDDIPAPTLRELGLRFVKIAIDVNTEELDRRIGERVETMFARGFIEEARRIGRGAVAADAVGYPQALAYLDGWSSKAELDAALVRATRRYAKRQRTWLRSEPNLHWVDAAKAYDELQRIAGDSLGWICPSEPRSRRYSIDKMW